MRKTVISATLNILIFVLAVCAWAYVLMFGEGLRFEVAGLASLKYYTVLSNLFSAFSSLIYAVYILKKRNTLGEKAPAFIKFLKLSSTGAVIVTFIIVISYLGPFFGFKTMYRNANFILHLAVPVIAGFDYILFAGRLTPGGYSKNRLTDSLLAIIPTALYGTVYAINVLSWGKEGNDIYGFVQWGIPTGFVIFFVILTINFVMCLFIWSASYQLSVKMEK